MSGILVLVRYSSTYLGLVVDLLLMGDVELINVSEASYVLVLILTELS